MKRTSGLIAACILFCCAAHAQITLSLQLPPPGQLHAEDLWDFTITNGGFEDLEIYLRGTVTSDQDGLIFEGTSAAFLLPAGYSGSLTEDQISPIDVTHVNSDYEELAVRTGTVPEGLYTVCLYAIDAVTGAEIGMHCIMHLVAHPASPQLIAPFDGAVLDEPHPVLSWTPPLPPPAGQLVYYEVEIVEVLGEQTPTEALEANPAWYHEYDLTAPTLPFPAGARPFEPGMTYAWRVTATTGEGFAIAPSEVFTFAYGAAAPAEILPLSPLAPCVGHVTEKLHTNVVHFEWEVSGNFHECEVVVCANPCGKQPPPPGPTPTPPTPGPVPTPTPAPGPGPTPTPTPTPGPTPPAGAPKTTTAGVWEALWDKLCPAQRASIQGLTGWDWVNAARRIIAEKEGGTTIADSASATPIAGGGDGTVGVTPADDWPDEEPGELPPLPPGWEWTPMGPHWTGEGPEPPELPPGWEWGPQRPAWIGEGYAPVAQKVIGTSGPIACESANLQERAVYSCELPINEMLNPGHAFVYQIYGIRTGSHGEEIGYLSEPHCLRFSPPDTETGEEPPPAKCGGCTVSHKWLKKTPITLTRPISYRPTGPDQLECMLPEGCIALSVLANDFDMLKQICVGCTPDSALKKIDGIAHDVQYTWSLTGPGQLLDTSHCTVFYKLPPSVPPKVKQTATIKCKIANVGGKAQDDPLEGKVKFEIQECDSTHCLSVTATVEQPRPKDYNEDFQERTARDCNPVEPEWKQGSSINGSLEVVEKICPHSYTILTADYHDDDILKLVCRAVSCGEDFQELKLNDPIIYTWSDQGAGGSFPFGNQGSHVLYRAPNDTTKTITFKVKVRDSQTQYKDDEKEKTDQADVRALLDLTAINISQPKRWRNITVGHAYVFKPTWKPATAKVQRIEWELDLGGADKKITKALCGPNLNPQTAALRFTTQKKEKNLEIAWRLHPHLHGVKTLKCRIFGEACGECCVCIDSSWSQSDFLGREPLAKDQFRLFFQKDGHSDDGRVRSLATVAKDDEYGERTNLHGRDCENWFLHWSKSTYGTCQHDHKSTDPKVVYEPGRSVSFTQGGKHYTVACNGVYVQESNTIYLTDGAAEKGKRAKWKSAVDWIQTSDMKWRDASGFNQTDFDLKGHTQCNRVYLHEYGHYLSMTRNWRPGQVWGRAYGARRTADQATGTAYANVGNNDIRFTVVRTGDYEKDKRADGKDCAPKFTMTLEVTYGGGHPRRQTTITLKNAWIVDGIKTRDITWSSDGNTTTGLVKVRRAFELMNGTHKWVFKENTLSEYLRANDPDNDFIPNKVEDKMGLRWDNDTTHTNHARSGTRTSSSHPQVPDQEFFADQHAFDNWGKVTPGQAKKDWANPGAQSDPEYK